MQRRKKQKNGSTPKKPTAEIAVSQQIQARIGKNLQALYASVVSEPFPDRLRSMIEELQKREFPDRKD